MKRVMTVNHRKMDNPIVFDVSTQPLLDAAALHVFNSFDSDWQFYVHLQQEPLVIAEQDRTAIEGDPESEQPPAYRDADRVNLTQQRAWYEAAKNGDATAAMQLLTHRKQHAYEYEDEWRLDDVIALPALSTPKSSLPRKGTRVVASTRKAKGKRSQKRAASRTKKQARRR